MIEFRQVTKRFTTKEGELTALQDISFKVSAGKVFGVIGASGAGKSTLIRCINLLERPTSGEVIVNGVPMQNLSSRGLTATRREIGMIFQHFNLLSSATVFDNVALPLRLIKTPKDQLTRRVSELLELVGLEEKADVYPAALSGGQKQRVAIARALATNPAVLLCDEATSALDPATTRSILGLLRDINRRLKITIVLITHEMEVVRAVCDEVAVLSAGRLVEIAPVAQIFSAPSSQVTADFVTASLHLDIPVSYAERLGQQYAPGRSPLVRLIIANRTLDSAVLSEAARNFGVDNHIVGARIDSAGTATYGALLLEIRGARQAAEEAIEYFKNNHIKTELLGYV